MRLKKLSIFLTTALAAGLCGADTYTFDPAHTTIGFQVRHLMVSNVDGSFKDYAGTIQLDPKDIAKSSVNVVIKTAGIDTGNVKRDTHLKSADFFEVEKYPEIAFHSTKILKTKSGYEAVGNLTIKDVTKTVTIPFTLSGPVENPFSPGEMHIGVEGGLTINRQDYHVKWNVPILDGKGVLISDDVKITLQVEAVKAPLASKN